MSYVRRLAQKKTGRRFPGLLFSLENETALSSVPGLLNRALYVLGETLKAEAPLTVNERISLEVIAPSWGKKPKTDPLSEMCLQSLRVSSRPSAFICGLFFARPGVPVCRPKLRDCVIRFAKTCSKFLGAHRSAQRFRATRPSVRPQC